MSTLLTLFPFIMPIKHPKLFFSLIAALPETAMTGYRLVQWVEEGWRTADSTLLIQPMRLKLSESPTVVGEYPSFSMPFFHLYLSPAGNY